MVPLVWSSNALTASSPFVLQLPISPTAYRYAGSPLAPGWAVAVAVAAFVGAGDAVADFAGAGVADDVLVGTGVVDACLVGVGAIAVGCGACPVPLLWSASR